MISAEIVAQLREFNIGSLTFHGYGIIIAVAIIISFFAFRRFYGETYSERLLPFGRLVVIALSILIFARIFSVISDLSFYIENPSLIIQTWSGGMSIFGVLIGLVVGFTISHMFIKNKKRTSLLQFLDAVVPFVALAQSIGRWANFVNQELYGSPTNVPWKMYVSPEYRLPGYEQYEYFHPTFLYESILNFTIFMLLIKFIRSKQSIPAGTISALYAIMYGIIRIGMNRLRIDNDFVWAGISITDIWATVLLCCGIVILMKAFHRYKLKKTTHDG